MVATYFVAQNVSAYDFSEKNEDGVTIYYKIISEDAKTCEVTWMEEGKDFNGGNIQFTDYVGEVNIPSTANGYQVTCIGEKAFMRCGSLTSVTIPNSVSRLAQGAFFKCVSLTSVEIPNSVTNIEGFVFDGCSSLETVSLGDHVRYIGTCAFYECTSLTAIAIPNSTTTVMNQAFSGCKSMTSLTLGNSLQTIGWSAFSGCGGVSDLVIPSSVRRIENHAFWGLRGLTSLTIPKSVTFIGDNPFSSCTELTSIVVEEGNPNYHSGIGGNAIIETNTNKLITGCMNTQMGEDITTIGTYAFYNCQGLTSAEIPNSVTSIGYCGFSHCSNLSSVTIPNSVITIGNGAFSNCTSLTSVEIPNSVTTIDAGAFSRCSGLTEVSIGNSVNSIGETAFFSCTSLTSITIPSSVTSIGKDAFNNCDHLTSIISYIIDVFETGSSAFYGCTDATLYVTKGLVDVYKRTSDWNRLRNIEELPGISLTLVCSDLGKVVVNDHITISNKVGEVSVYDGIDNEFEFTADEDCVLGRVLVNGLDVTRSVKNNHLKATVLPNSTIMVIFNPNGADVNGDGMVDISDVVMLVNIILGN